jgi:adenosine deaminase
VCLAVSAAATPARADTAGVERYLDRVRDEPARLVPLLERMPKGGDLHNHLSGAVYTEVLVRLGILNGACLDPLTLAASSPPCTMGTRPLSDVLRNNDLYNEVIAAWSMRGFTPSGTENGHDHFFATFGKFGAASSGRQPEMLADVAERAADQNEFYLETLVTPSFGETSALAARVPFDPDDLAGSRDRLLAGGAVDGIVAGAKASLDASEARYREILGCAGSRPPPGCRLPVRFQVQVLRAMPPNVVFAQLVVAFALMKADPRWVAVNLVQPEDDPTALRDYRLQMNMIRFLRGVSEAGNVTLHAGELWTGVAPPRDLTFHIRDAVNVAGAQRIGHGVDLIYEKDSPELLRELRRRDVAIEINLVSNEQILGVEGDEHPFPLYRRAGVPVVISTDDEGVSRSSMTGQYRLAVDNYDLRYRDLRQIARNGLSYSFLPGKSIWRRPSSQGIVAACATDTRGDPTPTPACARFLDASEKGQAQWRQEAAIAAFERRYG